MKDKLSHRERIQAIMRGETPDRPAISLWRHFYHLESTAKGLAEAMLDYQRKYDWDFMKINPRASYHVEDWGNKLDWSVREFDKHRKVKFAIESIEDWDKIGILSPSSPVLAEHLNAIRLIKKGSGKELPLLMTVFTPFSVAGDLMAREKMLLEHLAQDPKRVIRALENITITFEHYVKEIRNAGADGIFLATTEWATSEMMTYSQYAEYARPLDLRILKATGTDALNLLHVCRGNNYLKELSDYPVQMVNWDASDPTNPPIDEGTEFLKDKTAVGGIDQTGWLRHANPAEIAEEISKIKERMAGRRFIFGPGCTYDPQVPEKNIRAVREAI
jgi:uroporphyrinogen decarboxylase